MGVFLSLMKEEVANMNKELVIIIFVLGIFSLIKVALLIAYSFTLKPKEDSKNKHQAEEEEKEDEIQEKEAEEDFWQDW